ncbi:DUF1541 domain-containing protein [Lysinibacillus telephonicus]|uniref:DUF1541 domain-containing protein n=2 Tax=Lysinibacillus telephonicus TaxID=1714840 RepID=A0A431UMR4_9BACI|nr:DUF1541 domain-containing protein [Lysinibacillus telephonicus]
MKNKLLLLITSLFATILLTACGWNDTNNGDTSETGTTVTNNNEEMDKHEDGDTALPNHSSTGDVPEGLKEAENPKFPVGSKATIKGDHMEGMLGSEATIVGAYDTTVYSVSYTPTNGNEFQENHKWVIKEEIKGYGEETLDQGAEVVINADHEPGMLGATGVIDTVEDTTVYMVNFTSTTGETVANHKWLKESELSAE